jgi:DNA-binding transcriptional LysR family regulator
VTTNFQLLRDSAYLVALAEARTFEQAAKDVGARSAEAVRMGVRRLAQETNRSALFRMNRGKVVFTADGEQVLVAARRLVEHANSMVDDTIRLRFSTFPRLVARAAPAVQDFHRNRRNDGIRVWYHDISEDHRREGGRGLVRRASVGELDLVVATAGIEEPGTVEEPTYGWRLRVVLPSGTRRRKRIGVDALDGYNIVCAPRGHASRELLQRAFDDAGRILLPTMEVTDQRLARQIAHYSDNLATVLPSDAFEDHETADALGPPLIGPSGEEYQQLYSVYRAARLDASTEAQHQTRQAALKRFATSVRHQLWRYNDTDPQNVEVEAAQMDDPSAAS